MTFLALTGLTNLISTSILAIFVFVKKPNDKTARAYAWVNSAIAAWSLFYFLWQITSKPDIAYFWFQMLTFSAMWINQIFLYFVLTFVGTASEHRKLLMATGAFNIIFTILNFTGAMYPALEPRFGLGLWPNPTFIFPIYLVFWHAELLYAFASVVNALRKSAGRLHEQLRYMLVAFTLGYIGGCWNWFLWLKINLPPYPNILVTVYACIIAYAIVKHQLMDMNLLIRRTVIYSFVTAVVTIIYGVTIAALTRVTGGAGWASSIIAAFIITIVFLPLRTRIQKFVDRYFFRNSLDEQLLQEMTTGIAHEMKRPLAGISMPAELTLMDLADVQEGKAKLAAVMPKIQQRLEYIIQQSMDAGMKVDAIRAMSSLEEGKKENLNLSTVIAQALKRQEPLLKGIALKIEVPPRLPVTGNAQQLEIVLLNLIKNACEAMMASPRPSPEMGEGGADGASRSAEGEAASLMIKAWADESSVYVSVTDTGPGLSPAALSRVFEPYYSTKGPKGMGMGLYLSQKIARIHNGSLTVRSENGQGAEFILRLPKFIDQTERTVA